MCVPEGRFLSLRLGNGVFKKGVAAFRPKTAFSKGLREKAAMVPVELHWEGLEDVE